MGTAGVHDCTSNSKSSNWLSCGRGNSLGFFSSQLKEMRPLPSSPSTPSKLPIRDSLSLLLSAKPLLNITIFITISSFYCSSLKNSPWEAIIFRVIKQKKLLKQREPSVKIKAKMLWTRAGTCSTRHKKLKNE